MPFSFEHLFPSLPSFAHWIYWILALFVFLDGLVLTAFLVPGTLSIIAGGLLAQRGIIAFVDLVWFIAVAAMLGSAFSFRLGQMSASSLRVFAETRAAARAGDLLQRYGGFAMVLGRFLGPVSAFVSFAASTKEMGHRFALWNAASAFLYALVCSAIGYLFGRASGIIGVFAPRNVIFVVVALALLAVLWFVFSRVRPALPIFGELLQILLSALLGLPVVQRLILRHPKFAGFVAARFETARFLGLTATVLAVLFVYVFGVYLDSVFDFLGSPEVVFADTRIANLLHNLRDARLVAFFGWVSSLGGWQAVVTMLVGTSAALLVLRRHDLALGLWLSAVGNQLCVALLKSFFDRPRSTLGHFTELSGSFPSGHAAASVAVWGMLFYAAWRTGLLGATFAGVTAVTLATLIGLSRVYLVEHYLSDVLNGYLVGGLWLILGIAFCEWRRERTKSLSTPMNRPLASGIVVVTGMFALYLTAVISPPLNHPQAPSVIEVSDPSVIFAKPSVQKRTETLGGKPRKPINLVIIAKDSDSVINSMKRAGYAPTPTPRPGQLARALSADWTGGVPPDLLVIPTFWGHRPNDLAFTRMEADIKSGLRPNARLWQTDYQMQGRRLYVGTLTLETQIEWAVDGDVAEAPLVPTTAPLDALLGSLREFGIDARAVE